MKDIIENKLVISTAVLISSVLLFFLTKSIYQVCRILKYAKKFEHPACNTILGHWEILAQPTDKIHYSLREFASKYYPHYCLRVFIHPGINILSPDDCEIFLSSKKHSSKGEIYFLIQNWLKDGLLLSTGEKWSQRRRILTPAFHFTILKEFVNIFNEETDRFLEVISKVQSEVVNVCPIMSTFTLHAVTETAMGHKLDPEDPEQKKYVNSIFQLEDVLLHKMIRPWLYPVWLYFFTPTCRLEEKLLGNLKQFTTKVINERIFKFKKVPELNEDTQVENVYMGIKKKKRAMLDVLLKAMFDGEQIDYDGICEEVDTFMFEGHDTTSAALSFCLMLIANHPAIQDKIHHEIKSVLGEKCQPTYNDLQEMEFLERCIKESLRLYPSVHFISRHVDEDTYLTSGLLVPKDASVYIHIYDIHRNSEIFPNPEKFDPDRFLPENSLGRHPFAYIPFSAGPRNCIGQKFAMLEMKAVLVGIIQKYRLIPVDTPETIQLKLEIILRTTDGVKLKFEPR